MGLEAAELVLSVEENFEIEIPDEDTIAIVTVGQLRDYIAAKQRAEGRANVNADIIFDQLRTLIPYWLSVPVEQITPDARFEDLYA